MGHALGDTRGHWRLTGSTSMGALITTPLQGISNSHPRSTEQLDIGIHVRAEGFVPTPNTRMGIHDCGCRQHLSPLVLMAAWESSVCKSGGLYPLLMPASYSAPTCRLQWAWQRQGNVLAGKQKKEC